MAVDAVPEQRSSEGHGELILLADDELHVREVMAEVVASFGYRVIQVSDGLEAIEEFKAHREDIALAFLDVVMPHLGGMPLAISLRKIKPDIPVIFMTGYDKEHALEAEESLERCEILTKPVDFDELRRRIRELLD